nr:MAG TPA: hypothetical protein [Caudoviricetes sp.]
MMMTLLSCAIVPQSTYCVKRQNRDFRFFPPNLHETKQRTLVACLTSCPAVWYNRRVKHINVRCRSLHGECGLK